MLSKKRGLSAIVFMVAAVVMSVLLLNASSDASTSDTVKSVVLKIGNKTVTKKNYSLQNGKKVAVEVSVTPEKAKKKIVFKSKNKKVAIVSAKGVITAKKVGTAKIVVTAKGKNGKNKSTWVKIKVTGKASADTNPGNEPEETEEPADANPSNGPAETEEPADANPSNGPVETEEPADTNPGNEPAETETPGAVQTPGPITVKDHIIEFGSDKIYGKLYAPEKEGVYPAVIMCHGYNGIGTDFVKECTYFAQNGYIAYAFDFRGGSGRSQSSGKSTDMTIFTEEEDLITVFKNIKELSNVDSSHIFLHGGSQGGLVAALAAEELADEVKGLMLYFPAFNIPYDWTAMHPDVDKIPEVIPWWGLDLGREFAVSVHGYKTFEHIGSYPKNVLILYGAKDAIVQRSYMDQAKEVYKNCELIVYPNEGHGFTPAGVDKAKEELLRFMREQ